MSTYTQRQEDPFSSIDQAKISLSQCFGNAVHLYKCPQASVPYTKDITPGVHASDFWFPVSADSKENNKNRTWKLHNNSDFLTRGFLSLNLPALKLKKQYADSGYQIAYTPYVCHNLFDSIGLYYTDYKACEYDPVMLDFHANIQTNGYDKVLSYNENVGNTRELLTFGTSLPEADLSIPLPFFKGVQDAILFCAHKNLSVSVKASLRSLYSCIQLRQVTKTGIIPVAKPDIEAFLESPSTPFSYADDIVFWGRYACIDSNVRDALLSGDEPIPLILESIVAYDSDKTLSGNGLIAAELYWHGALKWFGFAARNKTGEEANCRSNYTTSPYNPLAGKNPVAYVSLSQDGQRLFSNIPAKIFNYFEAIDAPNSRLDTGIHFRSFAHHGGRYLEPNGCKSLTSGIKLNLSVAIQDKNDEEVIPSTYQLVVRGVMETLFHVKGGIFTEVA